jgi:hypothetical protein
MIKVATIAATAIPPYFNPAAGVFTSSLICKTYSYYFVAESNGWSLG